MKKTALITGASGGLGLEFARLFAKNGYDLVLVARNPNKLCQAKEELERDFGINAAVFVKDLSEKDAALDVHNFTSVNGISVDVLVNNAGFGDFGPFRHADWERQYEMVQVNVLALMQLTRCYLNEMVERKSGKILNVASVAAFVPGPLMSIYYASKAFVLSFTEALDVELKGSGISASALCPGPTKTGFEDAAALGQSGLFRHLKNAKAEDVAEFGYKKLMKKRVVAIPGLENKLINLSSKLAPRKLVRNIVHLIQK